MHGKCLEQCLAQSKHRVCCHSVIIEALGVQAYQGCSVNQLPRVLVPALPLISFLTLRDSLTLPLASLPLEQEGCKDQVHKSNQSNDQTGLRGMRVL